MATDQPLVIDIISSTDDDVIYILETRLSDSFTVPMQLQCLSEAIVVSLEVVSTQRGKRKVVSDAASDTPKKKKVAPSTIT